MSDINKVIDPINFLHMDSTMHWCTHDDKIEFTTGHQILELQQFLVQSLNKSHTINKDI